MRWLNRREYIKLFFIDDNHCHTVYYKASFNIDKLMMSDIIYGLALTMETDSPFGYEIERVSTFTISDISLPRSVSYASDEIGYTYPSMEITCGISGDLIITNETSGTKTVIKNCEQNEVINIDGNILLITSSSQTHQINKDFRYDRISCDKISKACVSFTIGQMFIC